MLGIEINEGLHKLWQKILQIHNQQHQKKM